MQFIQMIIGILVLFADSLKEKNSPALQELMEIIGISRIYIPDIMITN